MDLFSKVTKCGYKMWIENVDKKMWIKSMDKKYA